MAFVPIPTEIEMLPAGTADVTNPCLSPSSKQGQKNGFSARAKRAFLQPEVLRRTLRKRRVAASGIGQQRIQFKKSFKIKKQLLSIKFRDWLCPKKNTNLENFFSELSNIYLSRVSELYGQKL
jgi:hypothetical protein